ncbi:MAG TPA: hypothetical protein VHX42_04300 [Candidatus Babeliales bacterium]|jgi:C4-dicarboxylate transporter|nr:hypothetical protein [Candidatus Babeliales bacterium]
MHIKNIIFSLTMLSAGLFSSGAVAGNDTEFKVVKNLGKAGGAVIIMTTGTYAGAIAGGGIGLVATAAMTNLDLRSMAEGSVVGVMAGGLVGLALSYALAERLIDGKSNEDSSENKKEALKEDLKKRN